MFDIIYDWWLLLLRWLHIITGVTWIGTSIFFMWLDRTFKKEKGVDTKGYLGELWMIHGGGFYQVKKLEMGSIEVPKELHWFKWESYWTWLSGFLLLISIYYFNDGIFLIDSAILDLEHIEAVVIGLFSIFGSWFFYDYLWERETTRIKPIIGHIFTIVWLILMSYFLCHTLSGRAAFIHIGAMLGTWMTANVFLRIIPRQVLMVEAAKEGRVVNKEWSINAKNRSTHNTYFTLPLIFIMLSNHFPLTYGHELNWILVLILCFSGAAIREYFVKRITAPSRSKTCLLLGVISLVTVIKLSGNSSSQSEMPTHSHIEETNTIQDEPQEIIIENEKVANVHGKIIFQGQRPKLKKLFLPMNCKIGNKSEIFNNDVIINESSEIENVLVYISKGLPNRKYKVPTNQVILDQKYCVYGPRVLALRAGQPLLIKNSDSIFHNVKSFSKNNPSFNINMPKKDQEEIVIFKNPEINLQTKCSLHPWMVAMIGIFDHPFFDKTNGQGEFAFKSLPIGEYEITAFHEILGEKKANLKITEENFENLQNIEIIFNK